MSGMNMTTNTSTSTNTTPRNNFGAQIRAKRQSLGWSQRRLGEEAGISCQYISDIERTNKSCSKSVTKRLNDALGISISDTTDTTDNSTTAVPEPATLREETTTQPTTQTAAQPTTPPAESIKPIKPFKSIYTDITIPGSLVWFATVSNLSMNDVMMLARIAQAVESRTSDGEINWREVHDAINSILE